MLTSKGIAVWLEYEDSAIHLPHLKPVSYVENETSFTTAKIPTTQNRFTRKFVLRWSRASSTRPISAWCWVISSTATHLEIVEGRAFMDSSDMSTQSHSTVEFDSIDKSGTKSQLRKPRRMSFNSHKMGTIRLELHRATRPMPTRMESECVNFVLPDDAFESQPFAVFKFDFRHHDKQKGLTKSPPRLFDRLRKYSRGTANPPTASSSAHSSLGSSRIIRSVSPSIIDIDDSESSSTESQEDSVVIAKQGYKKSKIRDDPVKREDFSPKEHTSEHRREPTTDIAPTTSRKRSPDTSSVSGRTAPYLKHSPQPPAFTRAPKERSPSITYIGSSAGPAKKLSPPLVVKARKSSPRLQTDKVKHDTDKRQRVKEAEEKLAAAERRRRELEDAYVRTLEDRTEVETQKNAEMEAKIATLKEYH